MEIIKFVLLLITVSGVSFGESYRILGLFPYNGKSHNVMFNALMKGLAKRGHRVDVVTHWPEKNAPENYKVIVNLNGTLKSVVNSFSIEYVSSMSSSSAKWCATVYGNDICELMKLDGIQKIVKNPPKDPPYDLVITEVFGAHCFIGFGHLLKVPVVVMDSSSGYPWTSDFIGNDDNLAFVTSALLDTFDSTKFLDRLHNFLSYYYNIYAFQSLTNEVQTNSMRKYLVPDTPHVRDLEKSVALTLVNSHHVLFGVKPITASMKEVGGLHVGTDESKLSPDLQKWMDESSQGIVYFTFGSLVLIETLPKETILDIYKSLAKLTPLKVLMKIVKKDDLPPGLPKNVLTLPWIPQQAVLAHKNVKVFLTHGGLMGCQEALYYGIPMIGVPLFADQFRNIRSFVAKNMAVEIQVGDLTTANLDSALDKVLNDPTYSTSAKYYSKLFKDNPMSPMDTAIFWVEYVIRNGPIPLRSPALDLRWWQLSLLDIYVFVLLCLISLILLLLLILRFFSRLCFAKPTKPKTQ